MILATSDKSEHDSDDSTKGMEAKPKKRKVNNPSSSRNRVLLDENKLCGPNGLTKLEDIFKDFKFRGKNHEKQDLDNVLSKYEYWVHMLHPKHPFDQCLDRIEYLGAKKSSVKTHINKIRMGLLSAGTLKEGDGVVEQFDEFPTDEEDFETIGNLFEEDKTKNICTKSHDGTNNFDSLFASHSQEKQSSELDCFDNDYDDWMATIPETEKVSHLQNSTLNKRSGSCSLDSGVAVNSNHDLGCHSSLYSEGTQVEDIVNRSIKNSNTFKSLESCPTPIASMDENIPLENTTLIINSTF